MSSIYKNRKYKKFGDFIKAKQSKVQEIIIKMDRISQEQNTKAISMAMLQDILWKLWIIWEKEEYIEKIDPQVTLHYLLRTWEVDFWFKVRFFELVENLESIFDREYNRYICLLCEKTNICRSEINSFLLPQDELTSFSDKLNILRKIANKNSIPNALFPILSYSDKAKEMCSDYSEFYNFRNKVAHTENKISHFFNSYGDLDSSNQQYNASMKRVNDALKYIIDCGLDFDEVKMKFDKLIIDFKDELLSNNFIPEAPFLIECLETYFMLLIELFTNVHNSAI